MVIQRLPPPYIATLRSEELQFTMCMGILIAPRYILTTALCTKYNPKWVTINSTFRSGGDGEHIPILSSVVHPKFHLQSLTYDIAVLLLGRPSINTPATLTFDSYEPGTEGVMRGFGQVDVNGDFPYVLREARGTISSIADCNQKYDVQNHFQEDMMCVVGLTPCTGDNGGPLVVINKEGQEVVVALESWRSVDCNGPYGGYTRLSASQDFIKPFLPGEDVCKRSLERPSLKSIDDMCTKMNPSWVKINSKFRLGGDGEHIPILTTVVHPKFKRVALTYDIAVLLLARPSINTPATLTFDIYESGTKVVMRGFGRLDFNADFADVLREAKGTIAENSVCNQADRLDRLFQDDMICVMGLTTCTLDIGGPLTIVNKKGHEAVVALQSWDSYLCKGHFGGFTRLSASQDFIKPFLQGEDVCKRPVERPSLH
ncbi:hypothetical protein AC1031_004450 [Aphanomyces cochlioides]|nr:hypothetical protein AC1031_004450 [Aphanomyces cochlioides]